MINISWPYFDPGFANLAERINGPALIVSVDNKYSEDCTIFKINRVNKQDILMEVMQAFAEFNLTIIKGYISSDTDWFMDVFHVADIHGNKLEDHCARRVQLAIAAKSTTTSGSAEPPSLEECTALEITAADRPGLFSEISAVLADHHCDVVEAHAWSHNDRLACVAHISDGSSYKPIDDPQRLAAIEEHLTAVIRATATPTEMTKQTVKIAGIPERQGIQTNVERRLHQLMLSMRDFDSRLPDEERSKTIVSIENCDEKGYSVVTVDCKDRPRLLFDTICTLLDLQCLIFHGFIRSSEGSAFQEYFIRNADGHPLKTEREQNRVIKCLEAAIKRRPCEGAKLEIRAKSHIGLLSHITRVLRENSLAIVRADVKMQGEMAICAIYVRDMSGKPVDMESLESIRREMGASVHLQISNEIASMPNSTQRHSFDATDVMKSYSFSIWDALKSQLNRFFKFVIGVLSVR